MCPVQDCTKDIHAKGNGRCWMHRGKKYATPVVEVVAPVEPEVEVVAPVEPEVVSIMNDIIDELTEEFNDEAYESDEESIKPVKIAPSCKVVIAEYESDDEIDYECDNENYEESDDESYLEEVPVEYSDDTIELDESFYDEDNIDPFEELKRIEKEHMKVLDDAIRAQEAIDEAIRLENYYNIENMKVARIERDTRERENFARICKQYEINRSNESDPSESEESYSESEGSDSEESEGKLGFDPNKSLSSAEIDKIHSYKYYKLLNIINTDFFDRHSNWILYAIKNDNDLDANESVHMYCELAMRFSGVSALDDLFKNSIISLICNTTLTSKKSFMGATWFHIKKYIKREYPDEYSKWESFDKTADESTDSVYLFLSNLKQFGYISSNDIYNLYVESCAQFDPISKMKFSKMLNEHELTSKKRKIDKKSINVYEISPESIQRWVDLFNSSN